MRLILEILRYTKHNSCDYDMDVMATQYPFLTAIEQNRQAQSSTISTKTA